jgi:hypothetical protein
MTGTFLVTSYYCKITNYVIKQNLLLWLNRKHAMRLCLIPLNQLQADQLLLPTQILLLSCQTLNNSLKMLKIR